MPIPNWSRFWRPAAVVSVLTAFLSCQDPTIVEEEAPTESVGAQDVLFSVPDSSSLPDSLWYRSRLDSGSCAFYLLAKGPGVRFLPNIHPLTARDTLSVHTYRLGLHLGMTQTVTKEVGILREVRTARTAADSLAWSLLRTYDSLRKAIPADFKDTAFAGRREAFERVVAKLVFVGHPSAAAYKKLVPVGLDTAKINRQILNMAATSGLTLGEVVRRWSLPLDYAAAGKVLVTLKLDSASLHPFRLATPLSLDTLHLNEPPVGLAGKVSGKKGIATVKFTVANDSGDRTERFVLADVPDPRNHPVEVDFQDHPTLQPRSGTPTGKYTLRLDVSDSLGNLQSYTTNFVVASALDRSGPSITILAPTQAVVRDHNDSMLLVKVEAKDASGVKSVKIGGKESKQDSDGNWIQEVVVAVNGTSQPVAIQAVDGAGNVRDTQVLARRNEAPKPTAPRLSLVGPANGTLVPFDSTGVWVEWKAQTDFGTIVSVTVDGKSAKQEGDVWRLWVSLTPDGKLVNLPVRAQSSVDLSVTEFVSVGRRVDSAGPAVSWISPSQGSRVAYDVKSVEVKVGALDPSGVDSVRIGGKTPDTSGGQWKIVVDLSNPGELTRIHVKAWDHRGNMTDSVLLVSRDPIPGQLPPALSWKSPDKASGTVIPFAQSRYLVQVVLTDISGIDSSSVRINDAVAKPVNDSVWEQWVDLPPNGQAQTITVEAKNKRGVPTSGFRSVTRAKDQEAPTAARGERTSDRSVVFDTTSVEVAWTARDNDKIAQAWIQDTLVASDASGYHRRVPLVVGRQWIRFRAVDPAGNEFRDSVSVERLMDTVKSVQISDTNGKLRSGSFWVKLSCATAAATIRYTLDGSEPKSTSAIFADSIKIDTTITLKARAFAVGFTEGRVADQSYNIAVPISVSSSWNFVLVLMSDKSLWGFGDNAKNAFATGSTDFRSSPVKLDADVIQASAGKDYSMWVKSDGTLWMIGSNEFGQAGDLGGISKVVPTQIMSGVKKVAALHEGSVLVVKSDGALIAFGNNNYGQLGVGGRSNIALPKQISTSVVDVGGGWRHSYFLKSDNTLWSMGEAKNSKLGIGDFPVGGDSCRTVPVKTADSVGVISPYFGDANLFGKRDGSLWAYGWGGSGALGSGSLNDLPIPVNIPMAGRVKQTMTGGNHSLVLLENGDLYAAGKEIPGVSEFSPGEHLSFIKLTSGVNAMAAGYWASYVIFNDGTLWSMGRNSSGQLGVGTVTDSERLTRVRF